jgi:hypothetical protein
VSDIAGFTMRALPGGGRSRFRGGWALAATITAANKNGTTIGAFVMPALKEGIINRLGTL